MSESRELRSTLEYQLARAIRDLDNHVIGSRDYLLTMEQVVKLHRMVEEEKSPPISKDTLVIVGANLLGIILIIKHEVVEVISARALNLILKPRV
jgi:hypothetical protein